MNIGVGSFKGTADRRVYTITRLRTQSAWVRSCEMESVIIQRTLVRSPQQNSEFMQTHDNYMAPAWRNSKNRW